MFFFALCRADYREFCGFLGICILPEWEGMWQGAFMFFVLPKPNPSLPLLSFSSIVCQAEQVPENPSPPPGYAINPPMISSHYAVSMPNPNPIKARRGILLLFHLTHFPRTILPQNLNPLDHIFYVGQERHSFQPATTLLPMSTYLGSSLNCHTYHNEAVGDTRNNRSASA